MLSRLWDPSTVSEILTMEAADENASYGTVRVVDRGGIQFCA